jgi:Asp/Glu/hydantoin racemase
MRNYRIAHIIFQLADQTHTVAESYIVPASIMASGHRVDNVEVSLGVEAINALDRVILD